MSYLRNLALLVLLTTTAAGLLDYIFKAAVVTEYVGKVERQRFFAFFYTTSALATFLIQAVFGSRVLRRFGIGVAMGTLPVIAGLGSIVNLVVPGLWTSTVLRAGEISLRSSLFRAGYEQHYAPIPRAEKRPTKSVIDVVVERAGDAVGGGLIQLVLMFVVAASPLVVRMLAGAACSLYVIAVVIVQRLRAGYTQAIEKSLLERSVDLEAVDAVLDSLVDKEEEFAITLLSSVLDPRHVRMAFQGIHTGDPALHGLALEYLDSVLPDDLRAKVMRLIDAASQPAALAQTAKAEVDQGD